MQIDVQVLREDATGTGGGCKNVASVRGSLRVLDLFIEASGVNQSDELFRVLAVTLDFPDYFGYNWDALNECFSDYLILEHGGLGSEFGDRPGIAAQSVRLVFLNSIGLVANGDRLLVDLIGVLKYTARNNRSRRAADLAVVLQVSESVPDDQVIGMRQVVETYWGNRI